MPKREDEFWANQNGNLRYCVKHKHYYRADIGCQLCGYERLRTKQRAKSNPQQKDGVPLQ